VGARPIQSTLPAIDDTGVIAAVPVAILDRRLGKLGNKAVVYLLIHGLLSPGMRLLGSSILILSTDSQILTLQLESKFLKG